MNKPLFQGDLIGAEEACSLLRLSRPTFKKYRDQLGITGYRIRSRISFSKTEILQKIYTQLSPLEQKLHFAVFSHNHFEALRVSESIYDLRKIDLIDGHGAISLVCHLMSEIKKEGKYVHLICDDSNIFLKAMNFFGVLKQHFNSRIFWDESIIDSIPGRNFSPMLKLPITRLGVVGSHNTLTDDLISSLSHQGYSRDICSYIGWAIGELTDNATTHAKAHPCFVYLEQYGDDRRFLQFTIGDIGIGIPTSLKKNSRYTHLNDAVALLTSFKPNVSGRDDAEQRGKGLTDVLKIAMEFGSTLRVESNNIGFYLAFNAGNDNFSSHSPLFKSEGTIVSLLFIDGNFASLGRENVSTYIDSCLEKI
jgi:hypothetical protein